MILVWLILIPLIGGLLAWVLGSRRPDWARWVSIIALGVDSVFVLALSRESFNSLRLGSSSPWLIQCKYSWIPQLGIHFELALDGLSIILIGLTLFLGILSILVSWKEIRERVAFFHFNLMWILAGIIGVFLAMDLFLFYFFWELMLIPMYFLIAIWGHENRVYASIKFFLFTQLSGLLMLAAIVAVYFIHGQQSGSYTFSYSQLLETQFSINTARWLMWGFLIAFLVKLPAVPVHTWLPDAHTEAPTAGSVILAGLLLKTGAYGLIRFVIPLFPEAAIEIAPILMLLGAIGILYGAVLAFAQTDIKRLVAYTSVSHMGFVLVGVFATNRLAYQGTVMQMVCHGISTGALFILAGQLKERLHTRDMTRMSGLWKSVPRMGGVAMVFAMASLGLPGLGNFVGEFLILLGAYQTNIIITAIATVGLVFATIYALWIIQATFHGETALESKLQDLTVRESVIYAAMILVIVGLGLYPQPIFDLVNPSLPVAIAPTHSPVCSDAVAVGRLQEFVSHIIGGYS